MSDTKRRGERTSEHLTKDRSEDKGSSRDDKHRDRNREKAKSDKEKHKREDRNGPDNRERRHESSDKHGRHSHKERDHERTTSKEEHQEPHTQTRHDRKRAREDDSSSTAPNKKYREDTVVEKTPARDVASLSDKANPPDEDDEKAARRKKLQELAVVLQKQKQNLEQELERNKKRKAEDDKKKSPQDSKKNNNNALRLNSLGQEIDQYGRLAGPIIRPTTLLANKRAQEKKLKNMLKRTEAIPEVATNKYFDPNTAGKGRRTKRSFNWIKPGSLIRQGEELRQAKDLKEKTGKGKQQHDLDDMEDDTAQILVVSDNTKNDTEKLMRDERRAFIGKIPSVEWWDKPFLKVEKGIFSYGDESADSEIISKSVWSADTFLSTIPSVSASIDENVFHPAPLRPAAEPPPLPPQPLPLTRKEQKRITKQAREAKRQAEQDAIVVGAKEAPAPRVRIANIPRVFSQQAMQDPTAIEVMVRQEVKKRLQRHGERNQERKLSKDQRREKKKAKMFEDTSLYSYVALYKILVPISNLNRIKVDVNAQQRFLKGCCLMVAPPKTKVTPAEETPQDDPQTKKEEDKQIEEDGAAAEGELLKWSLIIVEGGPKSLRQYKKLMLRRVKWNESSKQKGGEKMEVDSDDDEKYDNIAKTMSCYLVWEGEVLQGSFHDFQVKYMKTELQARKFLQDRGCVHYWDMVKHFVPSEKPTTI